MNGLRLAPTSRTSRRRSAFRWCSTSASAPMQRRGTVEANDFKDMLSALQDAEAEFIVVGAHALAAQDAADLGWLESRGLKKRCG